MIRTAFFAIRNKNTTTAKKARVRIEKLRAKYKAYGTAQKAEKKQKRRKLKYFRWCLNEYTALGNE